MRVGFQNKEDVCSIEHIDYDSLQEQDLVQRVGVPIKKRLWPMGIVIPYYMYGSHSANELNKKSSLQGTKKQQELVRKGFSTWIDLGLNIDFKEVQSPEMATLRISFDKNKGSGAYLGSHILMLSDLKSHVNLSGGDNLTLDTVLHEIGHILGLGHEHQNPTFEVTWNKPIVDALLKAPPYSWTDDKIERNVYTKYDADGIAYKSEFDELSIMSYSFEPGCICYPSKYNLNGLPHNKTLSEGDKKAAVKLYGKDSHENRVIPLKANEKMTVSLDIDKQSDFSFSHTHPGVHTKYEISVDAEQSFGGLYISRKDTQEETLCKWIHHSLTFECCLKANIEYIFTFKFIYGINTDKLNISIHKTKKT